MRRIVIIGNGVSGITAARHIRKRSDDPILVVSSETDHFFSRTALMYVYMGHMTWRDIEPYESWFWARNRIELRRAQVARVDTAGRRLCLEGGGEIPWDVLVLATGSSSCMAGWPGQGLGGVQGLYGRPDLERMERDTAGITRAAVVGGGLIGIEMAEMLLSRGIAVTFLVREPSWMSQSFPAEESRMIVRHIREHDVDLRLSTELARILPDGGGRCRAVVTSAGEEIPAQFVGLTIGVVPNVDCLAGAGIEVDRGVLVDRMLRTNVENVYAIGDCAQLRETDPGRRPIEPVWYAGRRMGEALGRTLGGEPTEYDQAVWFNSAKFFDLEWQVYGNCPARTPHDERDLYWEHAGGKQAIRIRYGTADGAVRAFNLLGVRYRHELCDRWIASRTPLREVLAHLGRANFDPELHPQHEAALIAQYERDHPGEPPLRLAEPRGLGDWMRRLRAS